MASENDIARRVGDYEVLAPIAEGGMASIWLARDVNGAHDLVALKVIRSRYARNKEFVAMFRDEAEIASRLSHPHVIQMRGLGHDGKRWFLPMELLRGRSLLAVWRAAQASGTRVPYAVLAWVAARIADALHFAHEARDERGALLHVVHRDVNPANIFLTREGVPKLIDFGVARAKDRLSHTAAGIVKGTLAYLAPEQAHGEPADARSDVFALGVTLWELSVDRRLFQEESDVETVRRVREASVPNPASLVEGYPVALAEIVNRALARDPAERWQTAGALRDALDGFARSEPPPVDETSVRVLLEKLYGQAPPAEWERLADEAIAGPERIRVWDDERQKLTWMQAAVEEGEEGRQTDPGAPPEAPQEALRGRLERALDERVVALAGDASRALLARVHLERYLVDEILGDGAAAEAHAQASLAASPSAAGHAALRRLRHAGHAPGPTLVHVEAEIGFATTDAVRAYLLAERARLLEASGAEPAVVTAAWERVIAIFPADPAALRGVEASLLADASGRAAYVAHLGRMAEAYASEPRLSAWLHVERARILDRDLRQPDAAKGALLRALEQDGALGPVRAACVAHAVVHRDAAWLVSLWIAEAQLEPDLERAARLEVDAASVARHRLQDAGSAIPILERAAARAPAAGPTRRRALADLVVLYEGAGRMRDSLRARSALLGLLSERRERAHELAAIAALEESLGERRSAVAALESALALCPEDATLPEELDRVLLAESLTERRVSLWERQSAASEGPLRAACLVRAGRLAETMGDVARAANDFRAALVTHPADDEALDGLHRLLASPPPEARLTEARARIAAHTHGAHHTIDAGRRVAHLEAVALLEEEMCGDPAQAARVYEEILRVEPGRRGALLGLARTSARSGDVKTLARALLEEAAQAEDPGLADPLRVRAARALAPIDPERAAEIVDQVLARTPNEPEALLLRQRIHESAGRWSGVDASLAARIDAAKSDRERVDLWMARATLQRVRLRAPEGALASVRAALAIDPLHPAVRAELVLLLEWLGDPRALVDGLAALAAVQPDAACRARDRARAGEIAELVLSDDAAAVALYTGALADLPADAGLLDRLGRVLLRRAREGHVSPLLDHLKGRASLGPASRALAFDLALALLDAGDMAPATELLDRLVAGGPLALHAARTLERLARETHAAPLLANALAQEADVFESEAAKLGALHALAALVEWGLRGDPGATYDRILGVAPADLTALDAALWRTLSGLRAGEFRARERVAQLLSARVALPSDDPEKVHDHLAFALSLERGPEPLSDADAEQALRHYREALRLDPLSVVAASGTARLGEKLGRADASIAGTLAQADLAADLNRRATLLVHAAGRILTAADPGLGPRDQRLARAADLLERALDADPELPLAMSLLVGVRGEGAARERLLSSLRSAFERARTPEAVVRLGRELARVAATAPSDHVLAVDALRRVLEVVADDDGAREALAGELEAQGAWAEAIVALEELASRAREPRAKLAALLRLAERYAVTLRRPVDAERTLVAALDVDPTNVDALRRLLAVRREAGADAVEVSRLLARVGDLETDPGVKAAALTELAQLRAAEGDGPGAERALVEATAQSCSEERMDRLAALHAAAPMDQVRVFGAVVARAEELERPSPACLLRLGRLENQLARYADASAHLRLALGLAPATHEARAALAVSLARSGAATEAERLIMPMIAPDPSPLLGLANPVEAIATLEGALLEGGRRQESLVARELRAIGGGLDDAAHVGLRARRLPPIDVGVAVPLALPAATLRGSVVPPDVPAVLLELAAALFGAEEKLAPADRGALGVTSRDHVLAAAHPVVALVGRPATLLGVSRPVVAVSGRVDRVRIAMIDGPWVIVPTAALEQAEPVMTAALVRALVRIALGVPWVDDIAGPRLHALFWAIARQADWSFGTGLAPEHEGLVAEFAKRVGKAMARRQKKAVVEMGPSCVALGHLTVADAVAFERGIARAELRAAFVVTGDLLATIDAVRVAEPVFARATADVGPAALAATLRHPLVGDLVAFALSPAATALRAAVGSLWPRA